MYRILSRIQITGRISVEEVIELVDLAKNPNNSDENKLKWMNACQESILSSYSNKVESTPQFLMDSTPGFLGQSLPLI